MKLLVFAVLVVGLAGCNEKMPTAGQFDQLRVSLSEDKDLRQKIRSQCYKEFKAFGPSAGRVFAVVLNVKEPAAMPLTCDRIIKGIIEKRITYNDFVNLARLAR